MEKRIGRLLNKKEVVHHWDEDRKNNNDANLALFRLNAAHSRLHSFAKRHNKKVIEFFFEQAWLTK